MAEETQNAMFKYVKQQKEFTALDHQFCLKMSRTYGPLSFEKPTSLECNYDTNIVTRDCGDSNKYDQKCEDSGKQKPVPPQENLNGKRIPNIVIIGINTFGWTFINRSMKAPKETPKLVLQAPSKEIWEWNLDNIDQILMISNLVYIKIINICLAGFTIRIFKYTRAQLSAFVG